MTEFMKPDMEQSGAGVSESEFDEMRAKAGLLSTEQVNELLAQLHAPDKGVDHWTNPASNS
ncbi:MAG TPA: hypothetical protein VLE93_01205 [Candidatus Saccharimonadales bacterium]|nr:hypothetical protein [Candidatus Saccharimonadales bacterium]